MEENIYDFLGLTPKDGEAKVKAELEAQIKKWTNQLPRQAARAKAKLEVLKRFKAELDMLQEHADSYKLVKPTKVYGIDFGTTYSSIAFVDEFGKPVIVPNDIASPVTPSVVYFEPGYPITVGDVAKEALVGDPELVCSDVKLQLGKEDYVFRAHGNDYRPESIIALILKKLVIDAKTVLGEEVKDVVITYPVYFGIEEKVAITNAAKIADLNVVDAIPEPIAALYSYGLLDNDAPKTVLIYDLGGSSFDVTIVKTINGQAEIIATGGDHNLGGKDWDDAIREYTIKRYCEQTGESSDSVYDDSEVMGYLKLKAEIAKKQLTQRENSIIKLNGEKIEISRELFEEKTHDHLESTITKTHETMADAAKKGVTTYDKILLVGGSTEMPQVLKRLKQEFPNTPIEFCDPCEVIAKGAALYAAQVLQSNEDGDDCNMPYVPVLGQGFALSILHNTNNLMLHNVFVKNTPLPCAKMIHTKTICENQRTICLGIYDHDYTHTSTDMMFHMRFLVSKTVQLSKPLPINSPIDILVQVNEDGLLADINIIDVLNDDVIIVKPELDSIH